ncbi:MAG: histidine kinase [Bacteroidetes bacterium]|nr:histidine kinase [Bacteroidota bacterium]
MNTHPLRRNRLIREVSIAVPVIFASALIFGSLYVKSWTWGGYRVSLIVSVIFYVVMRILPGEAAPRLIDKLVPKNAPRSMAVWIVELGTYAIAGVGGTYLALTVSGWVLQRDFLPTWNAVYIQLFVGLLCSLLVSVCVYAVIFYREMLKKNEEAKAARDAAIVAELRALRAQINPHFLFNTLNSISSLIAINPARAERVVQKLSDAFRYVLLASEKETVTLSEELSFIENYLEIEQARFDERLKVTYRIDPASRDVLVPSLILQPLVENAVKHGLSKSRNGGELSISSEIHNSQMQIKVSDTGNGSVSQHDGTGLGLRNVEQRLARTYGNLASLTLHSVRPAGTDAVITIPVKS